jgi:hypothetical protein
MAVDMTAPAPTTVVGAQKLRLSSGRSVWVLEAADAVSVRVLGTESRLHSEKGESIAATVVLKRHPRPEETRIGHLVNALTLTLDLELAPDAATLQAVTTELGGPAQAAKLRSGTITLVADHENVILSAHPGATGRTMLGGTIGGDDAYKVVEALLGSADVQLKFEVQVVAAPSTRRLHIAGLWVDVWDRLGDNGAVVDQAVFGTAVQQLLNAGCITVTTDPPAPSDEVAFAVAEMLWDYRIMIGNPSEPGTLELRPRPDPNDRFSITESKVVGRLVTLTGDVELRALVESCGCAIDEFVTLMVADEMSGGLVPVAPRHRARERRATTVRPIAVAGAGVLTAGTLVAAPIHRPVAVLAPGLRPSLDFTVAPAAPPPGPVVANLSDKDWPDHKDPKLRWYAPVPALIDGATDGPTFFELHHEGLTSEGQPALRAVISVPFELHDPSPDRAGNRRAVAAQA